MHYIRPDCLAGLGNWILSMVIAWTCKYCGISIGLKTNKLRMLSQGIRTDIEIETVIDIAWQAVTNALC